MIAFCVLIMLIELTASDGKKFAVNVYQIAQVFDIRKGVKLVFCDGLELIAKETYEEFCFLVNSRCQSIGLECAILRRNV